MRKFFILAIIAAGLSGCAQPELPVDHFYRLDVAVPEKVFSTPLIDGVVEVGKFSAYGLVARRAIVYSAKNLPLELRDYNYHFWTAPPPIMLRDQLVEYLRAAAAAKTVVTPEMRISPDYVLAVKIKRLEKINGQRPMVTVELEMMLRNVRDDKQIFFNTYAVELKSTNNSVTEAVKAINRALGQIYASFVNDLAKGKQ